MMKNMTYVIEKHFSIPISTLIEPMVKQMHVTQGSTYQPNLFDFEFFVALARHGKLQLKHGILLMDLCAKIYLNELDWASACQVPFLMIASRFIDHVPTRDFLKQFFKIAFDELPSLEKSKHKKSKSKLKLKEFVQQDNPQDNTMPIYDKDAPAEVLKTLPPFQKPPEDHRVVDANRIIKRAYIIEVAQKVLEMRHYGISEDMRILILETNKISYDLHKRNNKGLMKLLSFFGNPEDLFEQYAYDAEREAREAELKRREEENELEKEAQKSKVKGRRNSMDSESSLMRETSSQVSSFNSQFSNNKYIEPPEIKYMKGSKSEFSLMGPKPVKAIENFKPIASRNLKSRAKPSRNIKSRAKPKRESYNNIPKPTYEMVSPKQNKSSSMSALYTDESEEEEELLSPPSSSSEDRPRFPPIKGSKSK